MYTVMLSALITQILVTNAIGMAQAPADGVQKNWQDKLLTVPFSVSEPGQDGPMLQLIRQDYESLEFGQSVIKTPMTIGDRSFQHGLGTHSVSHIRVHSPEPVQRFSAWIGVDNNVRTKNNMGSVVFTVSVDGEELYRSGIMRGEQGPERVDVDVKGARAIDLHVEDAGDGPACDHANWADAMITMQDGKSLWLDEIEPGIVPDLSSRYPFSFVYGGKHVDELLEDWQKETSSEELDADRTKITTIWTDPDTGLKLHWEAIRFSDFPAVEWMLHFENTGSADTPIIENIQALDLTLASPLSGNAPYLLHKTNGAPSNPTDFEVSTVVVDGENSQVMGGGGGRSSNKDFPFFKIETGRGSVIVAVGWSGQWQV